MARPFSFKLPEEAHDPEPPPFLGTWNVVYAAVLGWLLVLILVFAAFTRYFSRFYL